MTQLEISIAEQLLNLKQDVESTRFEFQEGSSELKPSDTVRLNEFIQAVLAMTHLSRELHQPMTLQIQGQASSTGQFEDNARLSQSRADLIMRRLTQKGIPAQFIKAQGIGVTSDSVNQSAVQKAQVTFQVHLPQP